jgi:hypothetical protein
MILFIVGAALMASGIGIIIAVRKPGDTHERTQVVSTMQVILSNFVLVLIISGGAMMALAIF